MSVDRKDDGFLDRWSKRKKAVQEEELEAVDAESSAEVIDAEPQSDEEALELLRERDPELAEQVSAIDIDELTYDDDFSIFMNKKVPEFIRRKALSKLWLSSPILANVDGLNDYDEDFRDAGSVIEAVQTALSKDDDQADEDGSVTKTAAADQPAGEKAEAVEAETDNQVTLDRPSEDEPDAALDEASGDISKV